MNMTDQMLSGVLSLPRLMAAGGFNANEPWVNGFKSIVSGIQIGLVQVWDKITPGLLLILGACIVIKVTMTWIEGMLSGDSVGLVGKGIHAGIIGIILMTGINKMPNISDFAWRSAGGIMVAFTPFETSSSTGGTGATAFVDDALESIFTSVKNNVIQMWDLSVKDQVGITEAENKTTVPGIGAVLSFVSNLADNMFAALLMVISFLLMLLFVALIMFQLIAGLFRIVAGLLFLPVGLAFWPLIDDWGKKAISIVVSGIIQMGIIAFMMGLLGKITEGMIIGYQAGHTALSIAGMELNGGKSLAVVLMMAMVLVMAVGTQVAISASTGIFSGLSFAVRGVSSSSSSGGGGGKSATPGGGTATPGGGAPGGGASVSPAGAGAGGAGAGAGGGAAATAGATVATAGIGAAVATANYMNKQINKS